MIYDLLSMLANGIVLLIFPHKRLVERLEKSYWILPRYLYHRYKSGRNADTYRKYRRHMLKAKYNLMNLITNSGWGW